MTKVLVVDDEKDIRVLLIDDLLDSGYEVVEAENGEEAMDRIYNDRPDVVLLDLMMPVMNGIQVLETLKADHHTNNPPVVLLTAVSADEGEQSAMELGCKHYVTKPWEPGTIQAVVKVALREAADGVSAEDSAFINTGDPQLNMKIGGGVPRAGLTFIEGEASTGKSVLCQHFAYAALMHGYGVCYFSSQHSPTGLVSQMVSLGLNSTRFYRSGDFLMKAIPNVDPSADCTEALLDLARQVTEMTRKFPFVIIDVITGVTKGSEESAIINFLSQCKELGNSGNSMVVAAHPAGMSGDALNAFRSVSDGYLALRIEKSGSKLNNVLEVFKVGNAEYQTGNRVYFVVEPGIGIRVDPTSRVSA